MLPKLKSLNGPEWEDSDRRAQNGPYSPDHPRTKRHATEHRGRRRIFQYTMFPLLEALNNRWRWLSFKTNALRPSIFLSPIHYRVLHLFITSIRSFI